MRDVNRSSRARSSCAEGQTEHSEARRAEIVNGGRRAFSRWGYEGATVARLESEIGLSRGVIFHYFDSKLDLFVALAIEENRRYISLIVEQGFDDALRSMASESPGGSGCCSRSRAVSATTPSSSRRWRGRATTASASQRGFRTRRPGGKLRPDVEPIHLGRFASMVLNGLALRIAGQAKIRSTSSR